jgi:hypothetical protein
MKARKILTALDFAMSLAFVVAGTAAMFSPDFMPVKGWRSWKLEYGTGAYFFVAFIIILSGLSIGVHGFKRWRTPE